MRLDDLREQLEIDKANYESRKRRALDVESKYLVNISFPIYVYLSRSTCTNVDCRRSRIFSSSFIDI